MLFCDVSGLSYKSFSTFRRKEVLCQARTRFLDDFPCTAILFFDKICSTLDNENEKGNRKAIGPVFRGMHRLSSLIKEEPLTQNR